jgi:hypothetical protein
MIDNQEVEHNDRRYIWSYEEDVSSPEKCWNWADGNHTTVPLAMLPHLNRAFIDCCASAVVTELDDQETDRFSEILEAMGATDEDFAAVGFRG